MINKISVIGLGKLGASMAAFAHGGFEVIGVDVNQLAGMITEIAGVKIAKKHIDGPMGVRGRNSDNDKLREVLGWEPQVSLEDGLKNTYQWIEKQVGEKFSAENEDKGKH